MGPGGLSCPRRNRAQRRGGRADLSLGSLFPALLCLWQVGIPRWGHFFAWNRRGRKYSGGGGGPSWLPSFSLFLPQGRQRHPIFPAPHPGDPAQGWSPCAHAAQPRARWRWSPSLRELPGSQLRQVVASLGHRCPGEASWRRSPELSLRGVKVSISQRGFIRDPIWKDPCEPKRLGNI